MNINHAIEEQALTKQKEQAYLKLCLSTLTCPKCGSPLTITECWDAGIDYKCTTCQSKFSV